MWAGIEPSEAQATATATNLGLKMPLEPVITLLQGACRCIPPIMWSSRWRTRLHFNDHMAASQQRGCGIMTAIEAQAKCGTASTVDQRREGGCCSNATTCQRAEMPRRIFFAFPSIGATRCLISNLAVLGGQHKRAMISWYRVGSGQKPRKFGDLANVGGEGETGGIGGYVPSSSQCQSRSGTFRQGPEIRLQFLRLFFFFFCWEFC